MGSIRAQQNKRGIERAINARKNEKKETSVGIPKTEIKRIRMKKVGGN